MKHIYIYFAFPPIIFCHQLEGVACLRGDETLEANEGGAAGSGHLEVGAVVIGAAQTHLEMHKKVR